MKEDGLAISVSVQRRNKEYRSRRERRECFGELVKFDGSHHRWLEGRGPSCCLITMIDGAANIRLSRFYEGETLATVMEVCSYRIKQYGIPEALYCDRKNRLYVPASRAMMNYWQG